MKKVNKGHIGTVETRARAEVFIKLGGKSTLNERFAPGKISPPTKRKLNFCHAYRFGKLTL